MYKCHGLTVYSSWPLKGPGADYSSSLVRNHHLATRLHVLNKLHGVARWFSAQMGIPGLGS